MSTMSIVPTSTQTQWTLVNRWGKEGGGGLQSSLQSSIKLIQIWSFLCFFLVSLSGGVRHFPLLFFFLFSTGYLNTDLIAKKHI